MSGPAVGYRLIPCPTCGAEVCETYVGYLVDWPALPPGQNGTCGLTVLAGGQVLMAGMGRAEDNRYNVHEHQPEGLE